MPRLQINQLRTRAENKLVVLKLGGSAITKKQEPMTPNLDAIKRLSKEIAEASLHQLIIIHGGGSYGHHVATQYKLKQGYTSNSQLQGFAKTHQAMIQLNSLVVNSLIYNNISAIPLPPSSFIITKLGRIETLYTRNIENFLKKGFTPILFGDVVLDSAIGFTILSGDQLASKLAIELRAKRIIMGVDVDGVFTDDPKNNNQAKLYQNITSKKLKNLLTKIHTSDSDVTGGMRGKLLELIPATEAGIESIIVNATKENNIYKILKGEKTISTTISRV